VKNEYFEDVEMKMLNSGSECIEYELLKAKDNKTIGKVFAYMDIVNELNINWILFEYFKKRDIALFVQEHDGIIENEFKNSYIYNICNEVFFRGVKLALEGI